MDYQAPQTPLGARTPHAHPAYVAVITTLVVLVAIGGYLALAYATGWWPFPGEPAMEPSPSASASPTTTPDPATAGWKTYTNTQYGFEFKYPPHLQETPSTLGPTGPIDPRSLRFQQANGQGGGIALQVIAEPLDPATIQGFYGTVGQENLTPVTIGGKTSYRYVDGDAGCGGPNYRISLTGTHHLSLAFGDCELDAPLIKDFTDQILSTFKFTTLTSSVPANWKQFSSRYFTLSFEVPPGIEVLDQPDHIYFSHGPYEMEEFGFGADNAFMRLIRYTGGETKATAEARFREQHRDIIQSTVTIDGTAFKRLSGIDATAHELSTGGRVFLVLFDRSMLIAFEGGTGAPSDPIGTAENILSTFRFSR